jgi:hypothetical protein
VPEAGATIALVHGAMMENLQKHWMHLNNFA